MTITHWKQGLDIFLIQAHYIQFINKLVTYRYFRNIKFSYIDPKERSLVKVFQQKVYLKNYISFGKLVESLAVLFWSYSKIACHNMTVRCDLCDLAITLSYSY